MTGILVKGVGGLYTVYCEGEYYFTKARGKFRRQTGKPIIGDRVDFTAAQAGDDFGVIERIHDRKNSLERPAVANIDLLLAVIACRQPEPDLLLTDRLLLHARMAGMEAVVVINKVDLAKDDEAAALSEQYEKSGYDVFRVNALDGAGVEPLKEKMAGKVSAYAGQSAVGKSSILNALCDELDIETGGLSKIQRGRHTTRHVELLPISGMSDDTWVCDTPGFSLLEMPVIEPSELKTYYPEFSLYDGECRFLGCNHLSEPGCAVREAADIGKLSKERLTRYAAIFGEVKEKWSRRYS